MAGRGSLVLIGRILQSGSDRRESLVLQFHLEGQLAGRIAAQRRHTQRTAGMASIFAKDLDQQIGSTVENCWLVIEIRLGVDVTGDLDEMGDVVQTAYQYIEYAQRIEGAQAA